MFRHRAREWERDDLYAARRTARATPICVQSEFSCGGFWLLLITRCSIYTHAYTSFALTNWLARAARECIWASATAPTVSAKHQSEKCIVRCVEYNERKQRSVRAFRFRHSAWSRRTQTATSGNVTIVGSDDIQREWVLCAAAVKRWSDSFGSIKCVSVKELILQTPSAEFWIHWVGETIYTQWIHNKRRKCLTAKSYFTMKYKKYLLVFYLNCSTFFIKILDINLIVLKLNWHGSYFIAVFKKHKLRYLKRSRLNL